MTAAVSVTLVPEVMDEDDVVRAVEVLGSVAVVP